MVQTPFNKPNEDDTDAIAVGRLVEVASRTWPGINKPGGVARVTCVHFQTSNGSEESNNFPVSHVDVHYIVGATKEKRVPVEFVKLAPQYETTKTTASSNPSDDDNNNKGKSTAAGNNNLRDRNLLLGRCRRCGSLRTDCGSCDWAIEEEENQPTSSSSSFKSTRKPKLAKETLASLPSQEEEENTSDEEDQLLAELVKQNQQLYRRYRRMRSRWQKDQWNSSSSDEDEEKKKKESGKRRASLKQTKNKHKDNDSSSESDYDETLLQLSVLETCASVNTSQHRSRSRLSLKYSPPRRRRNGGTQRATLSNNQQGRPPQQTSQPNSDQRRQTLSNATDQRSRTRQPLSDSTSMQQTPPPKPAGVDVDEDSDIGVAYDYSSPEAAGRNSSQDVILLLSSPESSSQSAPEYPSPLPHNNNDSDSAATRLDLGAEYASAANNNNNNNDADETLALSQFIQPEGQEVAENLPQDTLDRTRSLPYRELPRFFDRMATKVEDELLPDAKLKVAQLQRKLRQIEAPLRRLSSESDMGETTNRAEKMSALSEEYRQVMLELREQLIRDGSDQCLAAIRHLSDDRLYRKHKKKLSVQERKQCRGGGILEVRHLRMDAMEEAVQDVMRKLRNVSELCQLHQEMALDSEGGSSSVGTTNGSGGSDTEDYEAQDLFPMNMDSAVEPGFLPDQRNLPPFHPHMHASRVKKPSKSHIKRTRPDTCAKSSRKRGRSSKSLNAKTGPTSSAQVPGGGRRGGMEHSKSSPRRSTSTLRNDSSSLVQDSGANNVSEDRTLRSQNLNTEEEKVPTFNIFEAQDEPTNVLAERNNLPTRPQASTRRLNLKESSTTANARESHAPRERPPISDRMQSFLDANSGNGITWAESPQRDGPLENSNQQRTRLQNRGGRQLRMEDGRQNTQQRRHGRDRQSLEDVDRLPNAGEGEDQNAESATISAENLYSQLRNREDRTHVVVVLNPTPTEKGVSGLCGDLREYYPNYPQRCIVALQGICSHFNEYSQQPTTTVVTFFKTVLQLLQTHGSLTLQELLTSESPILPLHIRLLVECLHALELRLDASLAPSDGLVHELFSTNRRHLIGFLVLQLVDSAYSAVHPEAWALKVKNRSRVLQTLSPLRDALAKVTSLTEAGCRSIMEDLGCQQWRRGHSANHVFVSSVDPDAWKALLSSGIHSQAPQNVRLSAFDKQLPRCEVEALWKLLAYFGAPKSSEEGKHFVRWKLISKLLSGGVLAGQSDQSIDRLSPSESQLVSCEREIGYLVSLLSTGSLDSVPGTDSVIINLIRRAITLQVDDYMGNAGSRVACYPAINDKKSERKLIGNLWKATHPLRFMDSTSVRTESCSVFEIWQSFDSIPDSSAIQSLVLPSSLILRRCISLLPAWIQCVPAKKVRQSRLAKSIISLVKSLVDQAAEVEKAVSEKFVSGASLDSFEVAFSSKPSVESDTDLGRKAVFLRESAAYLKIISALSTRTDQVEEEFSVTLTKELRVQVRREDCGKRDFCSLSVFAQLCSIC
jgi:hypothetical protein